MQPWSALCRTPDAQMFKGAVGKVLPTRRELLLLTPAAQPDRTVDFFPL